jgi:hypothetical protein
MEPEYLKSLANEFRNLGMPFEKGLTDSEVLSAEHQFGFEFPPDLKLLLQSFLPVGEDFPNWRSGPEKELQDWLDWPFRGMCFDIGNNAFWLPEWGARPKNLEEAFEVARKALFEAPKLILSLASDIFRISRRSRAIPSCLSTRRTSSTMVSTWRPISTGSLG